MPLYEFRCDQCGKESEILVRSTDWKGTPCPQCGSTRLNKKFSVFASNSGSGVEMAAPECSGNAGACCRCGGGGPHRH